MNDELDQKPDADLDEIFAREVLGYHKTKVFGWGDREIWHDGETAKIVGLSTPEGDPYSEPWEPAFCADADTVLPWLEKHPYVSISRVKGDGWQVSILYHKDIPEGGYEEGVIAESWQDTFARAAVIALILASRSKG